MVYKTLIAPETLASILKDVAVFDCRFSLADTEKGRRDFQQAHLPGAHYLHLDEDLSGPIQGDQGGRHPLPDPAEFAQNLGSWGIDNQTQVVAYDDFGGAIAARFWWMLRWLGHEAVAVLEGGLPLWQSLNLPLTQDVAEVSPTEFKPQLKEQLLLNGDGVEQIRQDPEWCLVDARGAARYRGEVEPIDTVAGHIPGAINLPFAENLDETGGFLPRDQLAKRFQEILADKQPGQIVTYCGSGVTAAHNILAMAHAGLGMTRLYPGSWSGWIADPKRPVASPSR